MSELSVPDSSARRGGMTLVRLREGVYADGSAVDSVRGVPRRVPHLIADEFVRLDAEDVRPWEARVPAAVSCCGVAFEPGTLEEVPWGTQRPHKLCVDKVPYPQSLVERCFLDARGDRTKCTVADSELVGALLHEQLGVREEWELVDQDLDMWVYTASFNGVFPIDQRFPRGRDVGLELLDIVPAGGTAVRVDTCGVRDGCPDHLSTIETFTLPDDAVPLVERIEMLEKQASSISLNGLVWCLMAGECAKRTLFDPLW